MEPNPVLIFFHENFPRELPRIITIALRVSCERKTIQEILPEITVKITKGLCSNSLLWKEYQRFYQKLRLR